MLAALSDAEELAAGGVGGVGIPVSYTHLPAPMRIPPASHRRGTHHSAQSTPPSDRDDMPERRVPAAEMCIRDRLIILGVVGALFILLLSLLTNNYSLNNIKSKTVGDGQYGTARWATDQEIRKAYVTVPFDVAAWRAGKKRPTVQGLVLGSVQRGKRLDA